MRITNSLTFANHYVIVGIQLTVDGLNGNLGLTVIMIVEKESKREYKDVLIQNPTMVAYLVMEEQWKINNK